MLAASPVVAVVRPAHDLVEVVEGGDDGDGPEDLSRMRRA